MVSKAVVLTLLARCAAKTGEAIKIRAQAFVSYLKVSVLYSCIVSQLQGASGAGFLNCFDFFFQNTTFFYG